MSTEIEYSLNDTVVHATDPESEQLRIAYFREGRTASLPEEVIVSIEKGRQVRMHPRELIESIAKISGLEVSFDQQWIAKVEGVPGWVPVTPAVEPEPKPWTNVRYRAARAVKVTPELVGFLYAGAFPELRELKPWYSETNGRPGGVTYRDPMTLEDKKVAVGLYLVLRHGQAPQVLDQTKFEDLYEEAA